MDNELVEGVKSPQNIADLHKTLMNAYGEHLVPNLDFFSKKIVSDPNYAEGVRKNLIKVQGEDNVPDTKTFYDNLKKKDGSVSSPSSVIPSTSNEPTTEPTPKDNLPFDFAKSKSAIDLLKSKADSYNSKIKASQLSDDDKRTIRRLNGELGSNIGSLAVDQLTPDRLNSTGLIDNYNATIGQINGIAKKYKSLSPAEQKDYESTLQQLKDKVTQHNTAIEDEKNKPLSIRNAIDINQPFSGMFTKPTPPEAAPGPQKVNAPKGTVMSQITDYGSKYLPKQNITDNTKTNISKLGSNQPKEVPYDINQLIDDRVNNSTESAESVVKRIDDGDLIVEDGRLKENGSWLDNLGQGIKKTLDDIGLSMDINVAKMNHNDNELKYYMNQYNEKQKKGLPSTYEAKGDFWKALPEEAGAFAPYMAIGAVAPGLDAPLMGLSHAASSANEIWNDKKLTEQQKINAIKDSHMDETMIGTLQMGVLHSLGVTDVKQAKELLGNYAPTSKLFNSSKNILKALPMDMAKVAGVGATGQTVSNILQHNEGRDVDWNNVPEAAKSWVKMDLMFKAPQIFMAGVKVLDDARKWGVDKKDPDWFNSYNKNVQEQLHAIVSAPKNIYDKVILQLNDHLDEPIAQQTLQKIQDFKRLYDQMPHDMAPALKEKALSIIQLKTDVQNRLSEVTEPTMRYALEQRMKSYDGLLSKVFEGEPVKTTEIPGMPKTEPKVEAPVHPELEPNKITGKEEIPTDLEEKGEQIESTLEAERRRSNGERIFAVSEQDGTPTEVTSIEMLRNYTPDQLIAYKPKEEPLPEHQEIGKAILSHVGINPSPEATKVYDATNLDTINTEGLDDTQKKVIGDVSNVVRSISKLVDQSTGQKLTVTVHASPKSYAEAVARSGGDAQSARSKGFYLDTNGEIHLNMAKVTPETLLHEGFHPILDYMAKHNPKIIDELHSQLAELKGGQDIIDNAIENYDGDITQKKEAITDYIAKVANGDIVLDRTSFEKVKDWIINALKELGIPIDRKIESIKDIQDLAKKISEKFATGEEIAIKKLNDYKKNAETLSTSEGIDNDYKLSDVNGSSNRGIQLSKSNDEIKDLADETLKAVKTSIIDYKSIPNLKISRTLFYDNTRVGKLAIKNRITGYTPDVDGKGGFFYSYMPESLKNKAILAFTSANQAIQTIKRQLSNPESAQAIAAQNFQTAHLGNKSTLKALFGEKGSKALGIFQDSVKGNPKGELELLNAVVKSTIKISNQINQSGKNKGNPTASALEIKKVINRNGGNLDNIKSLNDFRDKILLSESGDSFGTRNIIFSEILQGKPTKITKATRDEHKIMHYKYGIPTLSEMAEGNNQPQLNNAETGDVIKLVKPYNEPIIYTTNKNIYKQYTDNPTDEMIENGISIKLLPESLNHESYPFILRGENVGLLDNYIAAPQLYQDYEKIKNVDKKKSFYSAGRTSEGTVGSFPQNPVSEGIPQFSRENKELQENKLILQNETTKQDNGKDTGGVNGSEMGGLEPRGKGIEVGLGETPKYVVGKSDRIVRDVSIVKKISIPDSEAAEIKKALPNAIFDDSFSEINSAEQFHKAISNSLKGNKHSSSVFVYPIEEYKNSRLFLTDDGKAGVAITKDGDIISVFSYGEGKNRVAQLLVNAVKDGGVSLDHYDTRLTDIYSQFGFVPVARVKFDRSEAPKTWDYELYKDYNNGEPDVIAMAYNGGDPNTLFERVGKFGEVNDLLKKTPYVDTWEQAKKLQQEFVAKQQFSKDNVEDKKLQSAIDAQRNSGISDENIRKGLESVKEDLGITDEDIDRLMTPKAEPIKEEIPTAKKWSGTLISKAGLQASDYPFSKDFDVRGGQEVATDMLSRIKSQATRNDISLASQLRRKVESMKGTNPHPTEYNIISAGTHLLNIDKQIETAIENGQNIDNLRQERDETAAVLRKLGNNAGRNLGLFNLIFHEANSSEIKVTVNSIKRTLNIKNIAESVSELDSQLKRGEINPIDYEKVKPYVEKIEKYKADLDVAEKTFEDRAKEFRKESEEAALKEAFEKGREDVLNSRRPVLERKGNKDLANRLRGLKINKGGEEAPKLDTGTAQFSKDVTTPKEEIWAKRINDIAAIVEGEKSIKDAISQLISEGKLNESDRVGIEQMIYKNILAEDATEKLKGFATAGETIITDAMVKEGVIKDIVEGVLHSGTSYDKVLDEATKLLQEQLPNVTRGMVSDAYIRKGEFKQETKGNLNKDIVAKRQALRRLDAKETRISALEDAAKFHTAANKSEKKKLLSEKEKEYDDKINKLNKDKKDAEKFYGESDATHRRINALEDELENLKNNIRKTVDPARVKALSDREIDVKKKISEEKKRLNTAEKEAGTFYGESNAKSERIQSLKDEIEDLENGIRKKAKTLNKTEYTGEEKKLVEKRDQLKKELAKEERAANRFYGESDSGNVKLEKMADELDRLINRKEKETKPEVVNEISEKQKELQNKINAERLAWDKEKKIKEIEDEMHSVQSSKQVYRKAIKDKKETSSALNAAKEELEKTYSEAGLRRETKELQPIKIEQDYQAEVDKVNNNSSLSADEKKATIEELKDARDAKLAGTKQGVVSLLSDALKDMREKSIEKANDALDNKDNDSFKSHNKTAMMLTDIASSIDPNGENIDDITRKAYGMINDLLKNKSLSKEDRIAIEKIKSDFENNSMLTANEMNAKRLKAQWEAEIRSNQRKINSGNFTEMPENEYDFRTNDELVRLNAERMKFSGRLKALANEAKEKNKSLVDKSLDVSSKALVSGIHTAAKVLEAGSFKPVMDSIVELSMGNLVGKYITQTNATTLRGAGEGVRALAAYRTRESALKHIEILKDKRSEALKQFSKAVNDNLSESEIAKAKKQFEKADLSYAISTMYRSIDANSLKTFKDYVFHSSTEYDEMMGKGSKKSLSDYTTKLEKTGYVLDGWVRIHGAMKTSLSARQAMMRSFSSTLAEFQKEGRQLNEDNISLAMIIAHNAYEEGRLTNKTAVSKLVTGWKNAENPYGRAAANIVFPVSTIAFNIAKRGIDYSTFGVEGWTRLAMEAKKGMKLNAAEGREYDGFWEAVRGGISRIPLEERKYITGAISRGLFGTALGLITFSGMATGNIKYGGTFDDQRKRQIMGSDEEPLGPNEWEFFGHRMGKVGNAFLNHLPEFMPMALVANHYQINKLGGDFSDKIQTDLQEVEARLPFQTFLGLAQPNKMGKTLTDRFTRFPLGAELGGYLDKNADLRDKSNTLNRIKSNVGLGYLNPSKEQQKQLDSVEKGVAEARAEAKTKAEFDQIEKEAALDRKEILSQPIEKEE